MKLYTKILSGSLINAFLDPTSVHHHSACRFRSTHEDIGSNGGVHLDSHGAICRYSRKYCGKGGGIIMSAHYDGHRKPILQYILRSGFVTDSYEMCKTWLDISRTLQGIICTITSYFSKKNRRYLSKMCWSLFRKFQHISYATFPGNGQRITLQFPVTFLIVFLNRWQVFTCVSWKSRHSDHRHWATFWITFL